MRWHTIKLSRLIDFPHKEKIIFKKGVYIKFAPPENFHQQRFYGGVQQNFIASLAKKKKKKKKNNNNKQTNKNNNKPTKHQFSYRFQYFHLLKHWNSLKGNNLFKLCHYLKIKAK